MAKLTHVKFRLSDLLLPVYIAAVTREFLWGLKGQTIAWVLTAVISAVILVTHAAFRRQRMWQPGMWRICLSRSRQRRADQVWGCQLYIKSFAMMVVQSTPESRRSGDDNHD
jgi:hypothetical protein